ncbi:MAG: hypothetical protein IPM59_11425 [Chloracidobacterium sp.]|nr:hypothetical protein [Chloracidobacterium sp.]
MTKHLFVRVTIVTMFVLGFSVAVAAQRAVSKPPKPIIFAVLNDGKTLEPIAYINKGKLAETVNGSDDQTLITAFNRAYYKPGTIYKLIFGGANAGNVTVKSSDAKAECSRNMATVTTRASKTPLQGLVMGIATNAPIKTASASYRRRPTAAEKDEIDALVKAEFMRQKLTPGTLRYQNLTALDLDRDGKAEIVGSYWVEIDRLTRGLLFFIASKGSNSKYALGYKEYRSIDQANVMSGDIKSVDEGVYHELLLDAFDYDGDGTSEVFTYIQSFEGAGFNAYRKSGGKWEQSYTTSNYHCGY